MGSSKETTSYRGRQDRERLAATAEQHVPGSRPAGGSNGRYSASTVGAEPSIELELVLRALDLTDAAGLALDPSGRALAGSPGFLRRYLTGREIEPLAALADLGLAPALVEPIRANLEARTGAAGPTVRVCDVFRVGDEPLVVVVVGECRRSSARGHEPGSESLDPPRPIRVLLVEDDAQVRAQALRSLQSDGLQVSGVESARDALDLVEAGARFDLMVTDVVMPEMSGPELAEALAAFLPHLAVLFVSGYADGRLVDSGPSWSPRAFLAKPHTPSALRAAVVELWGEMGRARA